MLGMYSELDKYTVSIFTLIDQGFDLGLDKYEIFDENYRGILNTAILNHYMFREICCLHPAEFKFKLNARLSLIMRNKYNALYKQKKIEFNPLFNHNMTEKYERDLSNNGQMNNNATNTNTTTDTTNSTSNSTNNNTTNETVTGSSNQKQLNSNYPSEEMITDDTSNSVFVSTGSFANGSQNTTDTTTDSGNNSTTNNSTNNGTTSNTSTSTGNSKNDISENYTKTTQGSSDSFDPNSAMLRFKKYCDSYNLDMQVIDELKDLFMQIF